MNEHVVATKELFAWERMDALVNQYLDLGWIIITVWAQDHGEPKQPSQHPHVLMGWIDRSREPQFPQR